MNQSMLTEKLSLDLQIQICEFLHPSQILALRPTCKAFHAATSQRIVWIHALYRICHENVLFLPTFPIHEMSIAELERAATAPRRWIALSSSKKRNKYGVLPSRISQPSRMTQHLKNWDIRDQLYLVPGGRYLVTCASSCLGVWDLGFVSDKDPLLQTTKVWVTVVPRIMGFLVNPTPDGMGIRILSYSRSCVLIVFDIYPQKEIIQDAKVAELMLDFLDDRPDFVNYFLYGNRIAIYARRKGIIIIWDFIANTMARWSIESEPGNLAKIFRATETAIMLIHTGDFDKFKHSLLIFQIPPLVPRPPLLSIEEELPKVAPILTFEYFDAPVVAGFPIPNCWYNDHLGSLSLSFYVVRSHQQCNVGQYKLDIASDLSNLSFTPINPHPVPESMLEFDTFYYDTTYRICENSTVNVFFRSPEVMQAFTLKASFDLLGDAHDSSQTPTTWDLNMAPLTYGCVGSRSFCPASGRFVYVDGVWDCVICDFLST